VEATAKVSVAAAAAMPLQVELCNNALASLLSSLFTFIISQVPTFGLLEGFSVVVHARCVSMSVRLGAACA